MRADKKLCVANVDSYWVIKKFESFNLFEIIIFYCNRNWEFFLAINTAFSALIFIPQNWIQSTHPFVRSHPFKQPTNHWTIDSFISIQCTTIYVEFCLFKISWCGERSFRWVWRRRCRRSVSVVQHTHWRIYASTNAICIQNKSSSKFDGTQLTIQHTQLFCFEQFWFRAPTHRTPISILLRHSVFIIQIFIWHKHSTFNSYTQFETF